MAGFRLEFGPKSTGVMVSLSSGRTLPCYHVGNLNNWVHAGFGEDTFPTSAFNIEAEDSKRRNL